jgi:hypothetical protein
METDILSLYATRPIVADMAVTSPIITGTTGITLSTTMSERRDDKVTWFYSSDSLTNFFDDSDSLMTTITMPFFDFGITVTPKVGTTNAGTDNADNSIILSLNLWTVNLC